MSMARETRPPSLLDRPPVGNDMLLGGLAAVVIAHLALPLAIIAVTSLLASTIAGKRPQTFVEEHVVEARFVRKGIKKDPKKLPDRIVPKLSTAPTDAIVVSKNEHPE